MLLSGRRRGACRAFAHSSMSGHGARLKINNGKDHPSTELYLPRRRRRAHLPFGWQRRRAIKEHYDSNASAATSDAIQAHAARPKTCSATPLYLLPSTGTAQGTEHAQQRCKLIRYRLRLLKQTNNLYQPLRRSSTSFLLMKTLQAV